MLKHIKNIKGEFDLKENIVWIVLVIILAFFLFIVFNQADMFNSMVYNGGNPPSP